MPRRLSFTALLAVPAALALIACAPDEPSRPALNSPDRDACGATAYSGLVGQNHAQFDFGAQNRPLRILGPNAPMTLDYDTERLNVDIDNQGMITRIWCG